MLVRRCARPYTTALGQTWQVTQDSADMHRALLTPQEEGCICGPPSGSMSSPLLMVPSHPGYCSSHTSQLVPSQQSPVANAWAASPIWVATV